MSVHRPVLTACHYSRYQISLFVRSIRRAPPKDKLLIERIIPRPPLPRSLLTITPNLRRTLPNLLPLEGLDSTTPTSSSVVHRVELSLETSSHLSIGLLFDLHLAFHSFLAKRFGLG